MNKILKAFILGLIFTTMAAGSFYAGSTWKAHALIWEDNELDPGLSKISEAKGSIKKLYVDKVNDKKLVDGAIKGMLTALGDPYSSYMDKKHFSMFKDETKGYFEGIGIQIGMKENKITVIAPIEDTPADKAGMKAGDLIAEIDGVKTEKMALNDAVDKIRGPGGTTVKIKIVRPSTKKTIDFKIVRSKISSPNVSGKILQKDIGYIRVHSFSEETTDKAKAELNKLKGKGIKGLVFDLRSNPGGLLEQAIKLSSLFIEKGVIVSTKGKSGINQQYTAQGDADSDSDLPMVVLVDHGSASASEIFAGAIQDHKRGTIVGDKTFGKASVQQVEMLSDNTAITITIAHYFTPSGRSIAKNGVKPDVLIKTPKKHDKENDIQLNKAIEILKTKMQKAGGPALKKAS